MNMNHKQHSEPFYISPKLFDNRRLKRRRCRWLERLRERQLQYMAQMQLRATAIKTDRDQRGRQKPIAKAMPNRWQQQQRRQVASHLPADITIDLLSDDDDEHDNDDADETNEQMEMPKKVKSSMAITLTESIILTSDDDNEENEKEKHNDLLRHRHLIHSSSPPPLAPLTLSETVEEVTVSLVPRSSTTANCRARARPINGYGAPVSFCNGYYPTAAATAAATGFLEVDVGAATSLPDDETTVHTVIANRIYELSLSKLREGLASSGMPEYSQDILPEQLQKLSPALRAKVAPLVAPMPPAPISLKLSSDLSISLISDDDDATATGNNQLTGSVSDLVRPVVMAAAAEAHAAAKLLKQQQPQLSVVQHLQYAGPGLRVPVALALPVMAGATGATITTAGTGSVTVAPTLPSATTSRRRKLG
ncbi:uncharacterized protein Dwil_GK10094 [Drosophila willistoni]|uniref:Protein a6 n=1 Tax=Drosophila willistoni TaxID=7260 RepID=B4NCS5_DROWI|nr:uncharacterized protein Dwil_GK10094 [Drosophila willistoni]